ncbi:4-hydroxythreonine-4-phosphate dehydrogenase PdxA [Pseudovibrio sp. SPO723]|uniref:4-hydroxythreonine-4-phosphate dehydrogenase PdxA n=1 Tax=Nesiotobacter zosterae TaxID=392721 RepID=UPI0029C1C5BA|nr:4-hydroxythreonine-4-phosphate dehydrogenase PdxA [Pseudovibrio sp. SPO723]MDX5593773.1 4-hydroxythreonine-4-phosphate dehydrogenase PdxA [Pseudovibrio sp. SPO723]
MLAPARALAVTMGEPSGIGPEITLMAWAERLKRDLPVFYVIADPELLETRAKQIGLKVKIKVCTPEDAHIVFHDALPVVPLSKSVNAVAGVPSSANAQMVLESIRTSVEHVRDGLACAVATNPIAKEVLYQAGFEHPGHTEYLGALSEMFGKGAQQPIMLLAGPDLMTVPVTLHIPLIKIWDVLSPQLIIDTARIVDRDLKRRFRLERPRIAVAGLNPHAGENGTMGTEDLEIIVPALDKLRDEGVDVRGPLPADTLFHESARETYDVVLAMYHDQALIPVKTLAFDDTVNVTLGLPFVRTSPDHGTAFGLAGHGTARPDSLSAAMRLAVALSEPELV